MIRAKNDKERKKIVDRIDAIYQETEDITIIEACSACGISNGTYYNWKKRIKNNKDNTKSDKKTNTKANNSADEHIFEKRVIELKKNKPFLGYIKISKQLKYSYDIKISPRKIKKILAKHNLDKNNPGPKKKHAPRRFERLSRNEMWMMDIMYYRLKKEGRFYLISALDDYSRYITSYGVFKRQTIDNAIDIVHQGIEENGSPTELLTDRGSQFHSWKGKNKFDRLLNNLGVKHILASPQHPQTIGKLESFHRNIQRELLRQKEFDTIKEAKRAIDKYIKYYNHERVHMGIDYLTPADRYYGLKKDKEKLLKTSFDNKDSIYLTGRIEGQPVRAKENKNGQIEVYLAGKKINDIKTKDKIKELFALN